VYRLFIDEVGHDNLNSRNDPKEQYLCLMGVILEIDSSHVDLTAQLDALKLSTLGTAQVVLHRREIIDKDQPPFNRLQDAQTRSNFDNGLMAIIANCDYTAIAVLIDKKKHFDTYNVWRFHPYHYCLTAMIERYVMFLDGRAANGDVMAEWRGIKPNMKLERAYTYLYNNGTPNMNADRFRSRLSSSQLKIRKKEANIAGLQLADLLANPTSRYLICKETNEQMTAPFGTQVMKILEDTKFHRDWRGRVKGCGIKCLP